MLDVARPSACLYNGLRAEPIEFGSSIPNALTNIGTHDKRILAQVLRLPHAGLKLPTTHAESVDIGLGAVGSNASLFIAFEASFILKAFS